MIPRHENALLPAGIHESTWVELVERFGTSTRRRRLLTGLHVAALHLANAGCTRIYVGGSFVRAKQNPNDIDVCWDVEGVDVDLVHPMFLDPHNGRVATLALFGCDFFPATVIEGMTGLTFLEFFQQRDGEPVGIVAIDLESL